jgi:hypothetical protein
MVAEADKILDVINTSPLSLREYLKSFTTMDVELSDLSRVAIRMEKAKKARLHGFVKLLYVDGVLIQIEGYDKERIK